MNKLCQSLGLRGKKSVSGHCSLPHSFCCGPFHSISPCIYQDAMILSHFRLSRSSSALPWQNSRLQRKPCEFHRCLSHSPCLSPLALNLFCITRLLLRDPLKESLSRLIPW